MKEKVTPRSFCDFTFVHSPSLSPDGEHLIYSETRVDEKKNEYRTDLVLRRTSTGEVVPLTSTGKESSPVFYKDGILFSSGRKTEEAKKEDPQKTDYYFLSLKGGEARKVFSLEKQVRQMKVLDEDHLLLTAQEFRPKEEDIVAIEQLPFWLNGAGYTAGQFSRLYLYTLSTGELEALTDEKEDVGFFNLNEEKTQVLYSSSPVQPLLPLYSSLHLLDLSSKQSKTLYDDGVFNFYFADFVTGGALVVGSYCKDYGINENPKVYFHNLKDQKLEEVSKEDFDADFGNSVGTDARFGGGQSLCVRDDLLYYLVTDHDHAYLDRMDLKGQVTRLTDTEDVEAFTLEAGKLYLAKMGEGELAEVYSYEDGKAKKVTNYSKVLENYQYSEIESFDFQSNGQVIKGYVMKPLGYEKGKSYPGVLEVHGGPKTALGTIYHHEMQLLAAQGYFVFYTNPHGSSGYGGEFADIRGKYGSIDYEDLMHFTDEVLKRYEDIDPDKLAVLGGSYGGFMTNWIIGHTDRFAVANSQRSISNWTSFYGVSDIGFYFAQDQTQADPWTKMDQLWSMSPVKYADKAKTPTLFIHSDSDYRCPLEQGIQMYAGLQTHGVDTRLVVFKNETHELSRSGKPKGRIRRLQEILDWFAKYL